MDNKIAGYLYIMVNPRFPEIKIGFAKDVEKRRRQLSTGTPDPFRVYGVCGVLKKLNDNEVRNIIKELNSGLHYNNEFYNMKPQSAFILFENLVKINGLESTLEFNPNKDSFVEELSKSKKVTHKQNDTVFFYIKGSTVKCIIKGDKYVLPVGSKIKEKELSKCDKKLIQPIRQKYQHLIDKNWCITEDIIFDTPSALVKFVLASNQNGWDYIINEDAKSLKEILYKTK